MPRRSEAEPRYRPLLDQIHDYTPRLFRALNYPKLVLPTHWDNFETAGNLAELPSHPFEMTPG